MGEIILFCENVPAVTQARSEKSNPMSFLSAPGVLIPANIPPAEKPFGDVIVPFGTNAIGSVMASIEVIHKVA